MSLCGYCRSSKTPQSCSKADIPRWVLQKFEERTKLFSTDVPSRVLQKFEDATKLFSSRYPSVGTAEVRRTYKVVLKPMSGSCWCGILQKSLEVHKETNNAYTYRKVHNYS